MEKGLIRKILARLRITPVILWLFLLSLGLRLLFLHWNTAEFTDGVEFINYSGFMTCARSPVYPLIIRIIHLFDFSYLTNGKVASMLMASLCVFPIFHIANILFNRKTAFYSCLFYIVSPLVFNNSIRIMSDTAHLFFFLSAIYYGIKSFLFYYKKDIALSVFLSGIAANTRPESLMFVPLLIILFLASLRRLQIFKTVFLFFVSGLSWYFFAARTLIRGLMMDEFDYLALYKWSFSTLNSFRFFDFLFSYVKALPFVVIYPVFILFVFGAWKTIRQRLNEDKRKQLYLLILGYVAVGLLIFVSIHQFWSPRFLIPLVPLLLIAAAFGLTQLNTVFKRWIVTTIFIISIFSGLISTLALLTSERDYFGDIKRCAEYIKENLSQKPVYSDEYGKTEFYSKGRILPYKRNYVKIGQYIALHSYYTDLEEEIEFLRRNYGIEILFETTSTVTPIYSLLKIAPSRANYVIAVEPKGPEYKSLILRVKSGNE